MVIQTPHTFKQVYRAELQSFLEKKNMPDLLANVPLIIHRKLHFMHDSIPTHFSLVACRYLNRKFPGQGISRSGSIAWPPHSPDLNPLDIYLWGDFKSLVYSSPVDDVETLRK
jgi:hypothetical protein